MINDINPKTTCTAGYLMIIMFQLISAYVNHCFDPFEFLAFLADNPHWIST
jgi:hypothetical protein